MASVNLTCSACSASVPCERCRAITRELRLAGHSVTASSRYEALRAAALGSYAFDACILFVNPDEPSIIDAANVLLNRTRVGLVVAPQTIGQRVLADNVFVIDAAQLEGKPFPTAWMAATSPIERDAAETQHLGSVDATTSDIESARRRLKSVARRAQHDVAASGFAGAGRLDLLASLEDELSWAKMSGTTFGLVLIHVARKNNTPLADPEGVLAHLQRWVARHIRAADVVAQGSDTLMVIVGEAGAQETLSAAGRIRKALRKAQKDAERDKSLGALRHLTLGIATYPTHGSTRAALLARATASAATLN